MKNRYNIDGLLVRWQDIEVKAYNTTATPMTLDIKFMVPSGNTCEKRFYGSDAFALRLWLGRHNPKLNERLNSIEAIARQKAERKYQLSVLDSNQLSVLDSNQLSVRDSNSGIAL